jgi:hypothetical protein
MNGNSLRIPWADEIAVLLSAIFEKLAEMYGEEHVLECIYQYVNRVEPSGTTAQHQITMVN